jgi:hypothetical protein
MQALPPQSGLKPYYISVFLILSLSYLAGRILEKYWLSPVSDVLTWTGSFWLSAMIYFLMIVILLDLARTANLIFHFLPEKTGISYANLKFITLLISIAVVTVTVTAGYINARHTVIKELKVSINKKAGELKQLKIALASDIHLGTIIGANRFGQMVEKINSLEPDIVLLTGDVIDEDIEPVLRHNIGDKLLSIKSKYGVYAVTGNHEYIGGVDEAVKYLCEHNVKMVRDTVIKIADSFYLAGREDKDRPRFYGKPRKPLDEILSGIDKSLPLIVMNHQPFELKEAEELDADLHLSGHTHHGQMFPINLITRMIYQISYGYRQEGDTHFYVSCGAGTWGPPIRIGNRPEIVNIILNFVPSESGSEKKL